MPNRFLLEIGTEEIPDWMIAGALTHLRDSFEKLLVENRLKGEVEWVDATPRRLVLQAKGLPRAQKDSVEVVVGPPKSAGDKAAEGFARKQGVDVSALETQKTPKGEYFAYRKKVAGRTTLEILAEAAPGIILGIPWPKAMYWTGKGGARFIRPIRWIVALLQGKVVEFEIAGVRSGKHTAGHRQFQKGKRRGAAIGVSIAKYEETLRDNGVIVHAGERRDKIQREASALLPPGCRIKEDAALLDTLTFITEWPTPILGAFDASYLELPQEVLVTVMRHHQKYFSVLREDGSLSPHFIAVMNTKADPDGLVRAGNERVLRARFNDARFFWKKDLERPLASRLEDLRHVTFLKDLGDRDSYFDKVQRIKMIAEELPGPSLLVQNAADLCKCDLTTYMVKEFTELQGIMGGIYARNQGPVQLNLHPDDWQRITDAIYDHYKPVAADDSTPRGEVGRLLAIADKLDTLRECFKVGLIPTGSKDPLGLRRNALGIVRIMIEWTMPIEFSLLCGGDSGLRDFLLDRVRYYFREVKGFQHDEVAAVLHPLAFDTNSPFLHELSGWLVAVREAKHSPDFLAAAGGFKRIRRILAKEGHFGQQAGYRALPGPPFSSREQLLDATEAALWDAFLGAKKNVQDLKAKGKAREALREFSNLRPAIDEYFDKVQVVHPDPAIRLIRFGMLDRILNGFLSIADFSEIVTSSN